MAFTNFRADVWAAAIERQRDHYCIGVNLCNRDHESEVKDYGQSITINWTKRPTVKDYVIGTDISAETLADSKLCKIAIDQMKYVNFLVEDVDELQSRADIMDACMKEAAAAIAQDADEFVYGLCTLATSVITNTQVTSANITSIISSAAQSLYENHVPQNEEIYLEVSPAIYQKLWLAKVLRTTANDDVFDNGFVGYFDNFKVYMTNSIKVTSGVHSCIARTKKAIAFAGQMKKMESYRPQNMFADAVKGLHIYGGGIVRADELIRLDLTPVEETAV